MNNKLSRFLHRQVTWGVSLAMVFATAGLESAHAKDRESSPIVVPKGSIIEVRMIDELDTGQTVTGQSFQASLAKPLSIDGKSLAPKDSLVRGRVSEVVSSGRLKRPASITLELTQLTLSSGRKLALQTAPYTIDGKSHALRNVALIGGGAAAGAALGGVAAGKKGAVVGGAIGAGAGTVTAYLTGKEEIVIPSEAQLAFTAGPVAGTSAGQPGQALVSGDRNRSVSRPVFTEQDRVTIRDFFKNRYSNLPPGLAKRNGNLPPGLEKQLRRNGKLPPGLQKRVEPFPSDLNGRLSRLPERIIRIILGRRAMIVDEQNTILDMIDDVLS